jgi:hypothetical protein
MSKEFCNKPTQQKAADIEAKEEAAEHTRLVLLRTILQKQQQNLHFLLPPLVPSRPLLLPLRKEWEEKRRRWWG